LIVRVDLQRGHLTLAVFPAGILPSAILNFPWQLWQVMSMGAFPLIKG
jgi:hypothetical protein